MRERGTLSFRCVVLLTTCLVLAAPAWSGHTLKLQEQQVLKNWLARHSEYRQGTDEDCDCADDIVDSIVDICCWIASVEGVARKGARIGIDLGCFNT